MSPLQDAEIGPFPIGAHITLRRMLLRNPNPKGTVLLLHGFPETLLAWHDIAHALADDFEVHAFDWPGYGLSSRPADGTFSYAPKDYARVLKDYIAQAGIDRSTLTIYATDIGALPTLLLALDEPDIARRIIVGDFAPLDRPQYMWESLQGLKAQPTSDAIRDFMNKNREEILANVFYRGLPDDARYAVSKELQDDMARGWDHGDMTSVDAFQRYYLHFSRDQAFLEANLGRLRTPVRVVWGGDDILIRKDMGREFAEQVGAPFHALPGVGHFPHLQAPAESIEEIRASFR